MAAGSTENSSWSALIQTQGGWLDPRLLRIVALFMGPGLDSPKELAGESFGAARLARRGLLNPSQKVMRRDDYHLVNITCQSSFSHNKHMNVLNNSNNTDISRVTLQEVINITSLPRIFLNPFPMLLHTHICVYTYIYFVCRNEIIYINLLYPFNMMSWRAFQVSIFFSF